MIDVVLRDRVENAAGRITGGAAGDLSNGWSGQPVLDATGAVVFASSATNLVPGGDANGRSPNLPLDAGTQRSHASVWTAMVCSVRGAA